jgi:hypothetical protein
MRQRSAGRTDVSRIAMQGTHPGSAGVWHKLGIGHQHHGARWMNRPLRHFAADFEHHLVPSLVDMMDIDYFSHR